MTEEKRVVHICHRQDWEGAQAAGEYRAHSLEQEGFIHCSQPDQVLRVANSFYAGLPGLVLLWIDPRRVEAEIRWEAVEGEVFPHIHGPLNIEAVVEVSDFHPDADGVFRRLK